MDAPPAPLHYAGMRAGLVSTCVCFALYLLFAGSLSLSEALTGAGLAMCGGVGTLLLTGVSARRFAFSTQHLPAWGHALSGLPAATGRTGLALITLLARPTVRSGRADTRPFRHGKVADARDRARRVTATLAMSLAPSTFVVSLPEERDEALLHGIDRRPPATNPDWLA